MMGEPNSSAGVAKMLIGFGSLMILVGVLYLYSDKLPFLRNFGRLPGDIAIEKDNYKIYFPWMTSLLLSLVLSLAFWLFNRFSR